MSNHPPKTDLINQVTEEKTFCTELGVCQRCHVTNDHQKSSVVLRWSDASFEASERLRKVYRLAVQRGNEIARKERGDLDNG